MVILSGPGGITRGLKWVSDGEEFMRDRKH